MSKLDNASKVLVSAFRKRWRRSAWALLKDADSQFMAFEAPSMKDQKALAKAFYSKAHATKVIDATPDEILKHLQPLCNYLAQLPIRQVTPKYVDSMISCEYLVFTTEDDCDRFAVDLEDDLVSWTPRSYPGNFMYDDWYERVGGFNAEFLGVLMKSTGESFSSKEQRLLKQSVVENVTSEGPDELWVFDFDSAGHIQNQIVIYIARDWPESHYVEPIADAIDAMSEVSIVQFAKRVGVLAQSEEADLPLELVDVVVKYGKTNNWKLLKKRLRSLLESGLDELQICQLEDQLRPHIFGGEKYFHATYDSGIDFL